MADPIVSDVKPAAPVTPAVQPTTPAPSPVVQVPTPPPVAKPTGVPVAPEEPKVVPINALHEEREKRQALAAELDMLKKIVSQQNQNVLYDINGRPVPAPQQQQQQQPIDESWKKEVEQLWETDPRKAVENTINNSLMGALQWYDSVQSGLEGQMNEVEQKYADFNVYRGEVSRFIRALPLNQRNNKGVVEGTYYLLRGQKVDDILARNEQEIIRKYQAGALAAGLPSGMGGTIPVAPNQVQLTAEQIAVAGAMGLSPEQYASQIK